MGFQRSKSDKANKSCKSGRADKISELIALGSVGETLYQISYIR